MTVLIIALAGLVFVAFVARVVAGDLRTFLLSPGSEVRQRSRRRQEPAEYRAQRFEFGDGHQQL